MRAGSSLITEFLTDKLCRSYGYKSNVSNVSNVIKVVNAQGLAEIWHNVLPSYAMLRLTYKFCKQPKKKE